ncbi:MAG: hypothetical protein JWO94_1442 [Verrucomicrobiaceae bacterium]|nr:hypothetical protein [Verrucomicrobiaceae bacterium]
MQERRFSPLLIVGFVVAAIGMAAVGWYLSGPGGPSEHAAPKAAQAKPEPKKDDLATTSPLVPESPGTPTAPAPVTSPPGMLLAPAGKSTAEQRAREAADQKVGLLLAQNPTVEGAREKLLVLFPGFSQYEKIAAAPHIVNLVGDEQLSTVVGFLKNPTTPIEAQETFFNDMLNRPPQLGWPVLVDVIGTPNHPLAQRAKELLTTIVGGDHGDDVSGWLQGVQAQLKQQGIDYEPSLGQRTPGQTQAVGQ